MDKGWIKLSRQIQDHWIWNDSEKLKAWLDLLMLANIESKKCAMREGLVTIRRGQYVTSIGKLADRWKWSKEKVRRFMNILERDGMITRKSDAFKTTITIVNYGKFQGERHSAETSDETSGKTSNETSGETRLKNIKESIKNEKEAVQPPLEEPAAAEEKKERIEVIPGYTQEELDESFLDGFIPMTDEEWEKLPPL